MNVRVLYKSYEPNLFIGRYQALFDLRDFELQKLINLPHSTEELPKQLANKLLQSGLITQDDLYYKLCIPKLHPQFTYQLAECMQERVSEIALKVANVIDGEFEKYQDHLNGNMHVFLGTVVLGYLWQKIWSQKNLQLTGGSAVLVENPEKCHIVYMDSVACGSNNKNILTWLNTPLQKNNHILARTLYDKNVIQTLHTADEEGILAPAGVAGEQLRLLKIVEMKQRKQDYVASFALKKPQITPLIIEELHSLLTKITQLGNDMNECLVDIYNNIYEEFKTEWGYAHKSDCAQAFYYVFCYTIMKEWQRIGMLSKWDVVPNV